MRPQLAPDDGDKKPKREIDIKAVARKALESANGDVQQGVALMAERIRKSPALFKALMEPLIGSACFREIGAICRSDRRKVWTTPNHSQSDSGSRVVELARGNLLMFRLPSGPMLGEATKEDVEKAAHFYRELSSDTGHKARWLERIAEHVPPERLVSHVLNNEQLQALQEQTKQ